MSSRVLTLLCLLAVAGLGEVSQATAARSSVPGNSPFLSYEGRTIVSPDATVRLGYPGIVVRLNFRGTDVAVRARTDSAELYLDVFTDDRSPVLVHVPRGESEVVLARDLPAGEHRLAIHKRIEAGVGVLEVVGLVVTGQLLPPPATPLRRLLFLGDSFTAGQATTVEDGGPPMHPDKAMRQNARLSYGRLLAERLDAQCHLVAVAGKGVLRDWQGLRSGRLAPEYYEHALPDDDARWDPAAYVPDVISVCLGNNDFDEGLPDQTDYVRLYVEFVRKLRRDAPRAEIFLLTSPTLRDDPDRVPKRTVQRAYLEEVVRRCADARVRVIPLAPRAVVPGDWHPSGTAHRAVADELEPAFRAALALPPASPTTALIPLP